MGHCWAFRDDISIGIVNIRIYSVGQRPVEKRIKSEKCYFSSFVQFIKEKNFKKGEWIFLAWNIHANDKNK